MSMLAGVAFAKSSPSDLAMDARLVKEVNSVQSGWTAGLNERFQGMTIQEVERMLMPLDLPLMPPTKSPRHESTKKSRVVPKDFDSRTAWPGCVQAIRDQGSCGGCWAFAAAETLSDRFCIASKGKINVTLSPQDLISCDVSKWTLGCNGGVPEYAWRWIEQNGIREESCLPFGGKAANTTVCSPTCVDGSTPITHKVVEGTTTILNSAPWAAQQDMVSSGPVQVMFLVYEDFLHYKSGIYKYTNGTLLGRHSVKIVAYGVSDEGVDYWTVANSWGSAWGEEGYFQIVRNVNDCQIETEMVYGTPEV